MINVGTVGVISAKGESSRFPGKNLADVYGKPLVLRAIERLIEADVCDMIVLNSDSDEILNLAPAGVMRYKRPKSQRDNVYHKPWGFYETAMNTLITIKSKHDYAVIFQPTHFLVSLEYIRKHVGVIKSWDDESIALKYYGAIFPSNEAAPTFLNLRPGAAGVRRLQLTSHDVADELIYDIHTPADLEIAKMLFVQLLEREGKVRFRQHGTVSYKSEDNCFGNFPNLEMALRHWEENR